MIEIHHRHHRHRHGDRVSRRHACVGQALPLIIIVVFVMALLIWDFIQTLRYGEDGRGKR